MGDKRQDIIDEANAITGDAPGGPILRYASSRIEARVAPIEHLIPEWVEQMERVNPNIEIYFVSSEDMEDFDDFYYNTLPQNFREYVSNIGLKESHEQPLQASCHHFDLNNDDQNDIALIHLPILDNYKHLSCAYTLARTLGAHHEALNTREKLIEFYESLPPAVHASFDLIPGTDQDFYLATLTHELGHIGHSDGGLVAEQDADQFMVNQLKATGIIPPNVLETDIALRAIKSMFTLDAVPVLLNGPEFSHSTNVLVHSHANDQTIDIRQIVTNTDKLKVLEHMSSDYMFGESGLIAKHPMFELNPSDEKHIEKALADAQDILQNMEEYEEGSAEWGNLNQQISQIIDDTIANLTNEKQQSFEYYIRGLAPHKCKLSLYAAQDKIIFASLEDLKLNDSEEERILTYLEHVHKTALKTLEHKSNNKYGYIGDIEMHFSPITETAETIQEDQKIVQMIRNGEISLQNGLLIMNNHGQNYYDYEDDYGGNILRQVIQQKIGDNPDIIYKTAVELYQNGDFTGDIHHLDTFFQQRFVYEFLEAAPLFSSVFQTPENTPDFQEPNVKGLPVLLPEEQQITPIQPAPIQPAPMSSIKTLKH